MLHKAIADLVSEGFAVVPLLKAEKRPVHDGWLKRTYTPEEFAEGLNVGVKCGAPSGHKVDVDLDAVEAVRASDLLPFTRVHGRPGKPHSHHWYVCPDLKTSHQYKDPTTGVMLVELRGTGGQTVVPPSVHPSGEQLTWENRRPYLPLSAAELQRIVAELATVALLSRHWPSGSRHVAALHVGGLLARLKIDATHIERLMGLVATIAGDEEGDDRARAARESAERYLKGEHTTGGRSLAELMPQGDTLLRAIYTWFGRQGDDRLDEMNAKHFVTTLGATTVVATETEDEVTFRKFDSFREWYSNDFVGKETVANFWLKHPHRRTYDAVKFAPPHAPDPMIKIGARDFNLWRGFDVTPLDGLRPEDHCARYLDHVYQVIAHGIEDHGNYVLDLLADTVQKPGRLIGKTLCLRGSQGVGKSSFVEAFGRLFHRRQFFIVNSRDQLVGSFNGHLSGRVVIFADEAIWGGHKQDEGTLKRLITQDSVLINRKHLDATMELNCAHLFMATNEDWSFPAGNLERRLVILDVAPPQRTIYYERLFAELTQPLFRPALLAYLLSRVVDEARLRRGLDTGALAEVKRLSSHPVQQYWHQVLEDGQITADEPWPLYVSSRALYEQYCEEMGFRRAGASLGTRGNFIAHWKPLLPGAPVTEKQRLKVNTARAGTTPHYHMLAVRCYKLPPLAVCRAHFDAVTGSRHQWPEEDATPTILPDHEDL